MRSLVKRLPALLLSGLALTAAMAQTGRSPGQKVYAAAQTKNMDKIVDAADVMTTACGNCHDKFREKATKAERCM